MDVKYAALTFDDGPNTIVTPMVLDLLERNGAVASFFLIGENINSESAEVVKRACEMGCEIENHSYTHTFMTKLTADQMREEVDRTEELITGITGRKSVFFRAPYIDINDLMYETIDRCFITGIGCRDWEPEATAAERIEGIMSQARDGALFLLHDMVGNLATVEALEAVLPVLTDQGYKFVTASELFRIKGIDPKDKERCYGVSFSVVPDDARKPA